MNEAYVEIYRSAPSRLPGRQQRWRFRCVAANGKVLTKSSEGYTNKDDAGWAANLAHPGLRREWP